MADKYYVKSETPAVNTPAVPFVTMTIGDLMRAILTGAGVGLVSTGIFLLLNKFIFAAALCRDGVQGCENAPLYSTIITVVVASIIGVVALAKVGIYRPLLVAVAAPVALWSLFAMINGILWYWALLVGALLFALAYGLFAWVSRIRAFVVSIILLIVLVVIVRSVLG